MRAHVHPRARTHARTLPAAARAWFSSVMTDEKMGVLEGTRSRVFHTHTRTNG